MLTLDLLDIQSEQEFKKKVTLCSQSIQTASNTGMCDPVYHFLFRGTDKNGQEFISFLDSFINYKKENKKDIYDNIREISKNEDYTKMTIEEMNIPPDILLRIESSKKMTKNM